MVGGTITAAALAVIGLTGGGADGPGRASLAALTAVEATIVALGGVLVRIAVREGVAGARPCWRPRSVRWSSVS
jgi:hypothetical protein